jgi:circadian clock protein KaiC
MVKKQQFIKSGIQGFDQLLGGGLPPGKAILISGGPGTGKTTLTTEFIYRGITEFNEPGVFVTLEQSVESLLDNFKSFEWDLEELIEQKKLIIIDASPTKPSTAQSRDFVVRVEHPVASERPFSIDTIISLIHDARRKLKARRIVVDSITNFLLQYDDQFEARYDMITLIKSLKMANVATLITSETLPGFSTSGFDIAPFLMDGIIILYLLRHGNSKVRAMEVMKLRGQEHGLSAALVQMKDTGIEVYPDEPVFPEETREIVW